MAEYVSASFVIHALPFTASAHKMNASRPHDGDTGDEGAGDGDLGGAAAGAAAAGAGVHSGFLAKKLNPWCGGDTCSYPAACMKSLVKAKTQLSCAAHSVTRARVEVTWSWARSGDEKESVGKLDGGTQCSDMIGTGSWRA